MIQEFFIKRNSTVPYLRMELINDGRYDFHRSMLFNNAIQDATITFSMWDTETGILKVSNEPAEIVEANSEGCEEKYIIQYRWKERDTRKPGIYEGVFKINFRGDIIEDGVEYPEGILKMPIQEDLMIYVR